jgi:hypothetical protein
MKLMGLKHSENLLEGWTIFGILLPTVPDQIGHYEAVLRWQLREISRQ